MLPRVFQPTNKFFSINHSTALFLAVLSLGLFTAPKAALAAWGPTGSVTPLTAFSPAWDSTAGGGAFSYCVPGPSIAYSSSAGRSLGSWYTTFAGAPNNTKTQVQPVSATGAPAGSAANVSSTLPSEGFNSCVGTSVAAGPDGTFLVIWPNFAARNTGTIYGQVVDANGTPIGPNLTISSRTDYKWLDGRTAGKTVGATRIGVAWSAEQQRYLVTWAADVTAAFPSANHPPQMVGRFIDASGAGIGGDFLVTNTTSSLPVMSGGISIVSAGAGRWIVVTSMGNPGGTLVNPKKVFGQVVGVSGPVGDPFNLSSDSVAQRAWPAIAYNSATRQFMAVYSGGGSGGQGPEFARLLDSAGTPLGTDIPLGGGNGASIDVAAGGHDGYLATWHTRAGKVLAAHLFADGTVNGAPQEVQGPSPAEGQRPAAAYDPSSNSFIVAWAGQTVTGGAFNNYSRSWSVPPAPRVTVTPAGTGKGAVTSSPAGIDCGTTCSAYFNYGATVTLTATAEPGTTFTGWSGACSGSEATCTVTADAAKDVSANFASDSPGPGPAPDPSPGPGPTPGPSPAATFRAVSAATASGTVATVARVPGPGKLVMKVTRSVGGRTVAVGSARKSAGTAGRYTLRCKVDSATRKAQGSGRVRLRVMTTFTATDGTARTVTRYVRLRSLKPQFTG